MFAILLDLSVYMQKDGDDGNEEKRRTFMTDDSLTGQQATLTSASSNRALSRVDCLPDVSCIFDDTFRIPFRFNDQFCRLLKFPLRIRSELFRIFVSIAFESSRCLGLKFCIEPCETRAKVSRRSLRLHVKEVDYTRRKYMEEYLCAPITNGNIPVY